VTDNGGSFTVRLYNPDQDLGASMHAEYNDGNPPNFTSVFTFSGCP
jgi:hypothetical protein